MSEESKEFDLANHKRSWLIVNACAMVLHVVLSKGFWHHDLELFDDFYIFFFLFIPWCGIGGANIAFLVLACVHRRPRELIMLHGVLVMFWIALALIERHLMRIPQGVIDIGG